MADHGLRTTGVHTGNFGKPKVKAGASVKFSKETLSKPELKIPVKEQAFARLSQAYELTEDPKLKAGLLEMIRSYKATTNKSVSR